MDEKIMSLFQIKEKIRIWKNNGKKIVFTNGCFDILHIGHITYLYEAAGLGDKLIIGINSDVSVKRLKGDSRPINNEYERMLMLSALGFVDGVILFDEDTPYFLIKEIVPDVLVKGGDWLPEQIIGSDIVMSNGGEVKSLTFLEGFSTTGTIERVLKVYGGKNEWWKRESNC